MFGSILGDIVGSRFEFSKPKGFNAKTVELFTDDCFFTDDTVMSIATKYAILSGCSYRMAYTELGKKYPSVGYGTMFKKWLNDPTHKPYNSYGNGSAMRVGFIGEHFQTLEEVKREARESASCTHNHPEGMQGAEATAVCVYLARHGCSKREIASYMRRCYGYNVDTPLRLRRPFSKFDIRCNKTVPLAVRCFLESNDWESCMRNVLSITCDTDTVGCIAGGIAEAYYGETGFDNIAILRRYLTKVKIQGRPDMFLFNWASMN